jgi:hypothetical protein
VLDTTLDKTQYEDKQQQQKHNTKCAEHHYTQTNTNNVYRTWALLQTTGGKDEPTSFSMQNS